MVRARELAVLDWALLATVPLSLVPGVARVTAIPALWVVPGWFLARKTLGARGFGSVVLAMALGVASSTAICLPATALSSRPTTPGLLASVAVFALACTRLRAPIALPRVPPPPRAFFVLLGAFGLLRLACAIRQAEPDLSTPDGAYFVGMVRALATSFPPVCFEQAPLRLLQPWGYWSLYAATHVVSGWSIAQTLGIASALLAVVFALSVYFLAYVLTEDRLSAALTLPFALGGGGAGWIVRSLGSGRLALDPLGWGGASSPAENVWDGFYDLPALVVLTLVLTLATLALRTRSASLAVMAFAVGAILPFHHPAYFVVLGLSLGAALAFEIGRRRASWLALAGVALAALPFLVVYGRLYAPSVPAQAPFFTDLISPAYWLGRSYERLLALLGWGGLWLVPATYAAAKVRLLPDETSLATRSFLVALFGVCVALAVFTVNAARNTHWTLDPLAIALVVLTSSACASMIRARRSAGIGVTSALVALGMVSGHWERRLPAHLAALVRPTSTASADQRALAEWLRAGTDPSAVFVTPANDVPAIDAVEGLAERRVFYGSTFHLLLTTPAEALRAREETNGEMLRDPRAPALAREGVDYVVQSPARDTGGAEAWRAFEAPLFESGSFAVYRAGQAPGR